MSRALEKELSRLTGEENLALALVKVETWARNFEALGAEAPGARDLDPDVARETLDEVATVLGCDDDHDSIQSALDQLFGMVTGGSTPVTPLSVEHPRQTGDSTPKGPAKFRPGPTPPRKGGVAKTNPKVVPFDEAHVAKTAAKKGWRHDPDARAKTTTIASAEAKWGNSKPGKVVG